MPSSVQFLSCPNVEVQTRASGLISGRTDGYPNLGWQRGNQQSLDIWGTFFASYACKTLIRVVATLVSQRRSLARMFWYFCNLARPLTFCQSADLLFGPGTEVSSDSSAGLECGEEEIARIQPPLARSFKDVVLSRGGLTTLDYIMG